MSGILELRPSSWEFERLSWTAVRILPRFLRTVVIAEGVETAVEFATLRALGVPWAQGFHIGCPEALANRTRPLISK